LKKQQTPNFQNIKLQQEEPLPSPTNTSVTVTNHA